MKMKWRERYNCHTLNINSLFTIHIDWEVGGYIVRYGKLKLKESIPDIKTAKRIAMRNVSKHLTLALADLSVHANEDNMRKKLM
jgi:hypothetical protein